MNSTNGSVRIGPISLFTLVIILCLAVMAVLSATTAQATYSAAEKQALFIFGEEVEMITKGRHDPCVGIRAVPIAEAMLAIVLMDHFMRQRAQNGDVTTSIPRWS